MLNFTTSIKEFNKASKSLTDSLELIYQSQLPRSTKKKASRLLNTRVNNLRQRINKMVKLHAVDKKLHFKEIWRIVYGRLQEQTGFNAKVKGLEHGVIPLDAVFKFNKERELLGIVGSL